MRLTAVLVLPLAAVLLLALLSCSTCELDGFDPEEDAGDEDIEDGFGVAAGAAAESQQHLQHHSTGRGPPGCSTPGSFIQRLACYSLELMLQDWHDKASNSTIAGVSPEAGKCF